MHEKDSSQSVRDGDNTASRVTDPEMVGASPITSIWDDVVMHLERSVEADLLSTDPDRTVKAIKSLRQFVVASSMNKAVVGDSEVLRPRLLELLGRFSWWSSRQIEVCAELCGLINSLVRDYPALSENVLSDLDLVKNLLEVCLQDGTDATVRESCFLLLRSLFGAEDLSSVISQTNPVRSRQIAALNLFTDATLRKLLSFTKEVNLSHSGNAWLTANACCYLMQILALLATNSELAARLQRLNAVQLSHDLISSTNPIQSSLSSTSSSAFLPTYLVSPGPTCQLISRFALKLLVHLLFHVNESLEAFRIAVQERDPCKLLACYVHLLGCCSTATSATSRLQVSENYSKRMRKLVGRMSQQPEIECHTETTNVEPMLPSTSPCFGCSQPSPGVLSSRVPVTHGTQIFVGILRGLLYWRLVSEAKSKNVDAMDQFGNHVASATGLDLSDDDVALMIIQPLTEGCLNIEDIRILSWICHVLVLVLNGRPGLHMWAMYTNSFIRELNSRVTVMINAVQEASNYHHHIQFIEHLIPLIKLIACLASSCEVIRVLFTETSMCNKLIDFTLRLKPLGAEHTNLMLEFQHSISLLLHVLSRSFSAHHSYFRQEGTVEYLLQLIDANLLSACRGHSLCADLIEAASSTLVNVLLPASPIRQASSSLLDRCISTCIRLIKSTEQQPRASTSSCTSEETSCSLPELTPDLRTCSTLQPDDLQHSLALFRLNGIWGLANLLHCATAEFCSELFSRLVSGGVWLELVHPVSSVQVVNRTAPQQNRPNVHSESGQSLLCRSTSRDSGDPTKDREINSIESDSTSVGASKPENQSPECSYSSTEPLNPPNRKKLSVQILLVYYTLMLLRNLLRHKKVIDIIVSEHWWNITQLLISVLEGDYPQPVKEQAILVLAHIANGQTALEQLHRNEDLTEKIKLFMRSPDRYIKAAALTATYNLLGLGRDRSDPVFIGNTTNQSSGTIFGSYHRRFHHRHPRYKERSKRRRDSTTSSSPPPPTESGQREIIPCVTQSTLQETEELEDEDQDVVVEHSSVSGLPSGSNYPLWSARSAEIERSSEDSLIESAVGQSHSSSRRHQRVFRSWNPPVEPPTIMDSIDLLAVHTDVPPDNEIGTDPTDPVRSSSGSLSSSSTSSTSCAEEGLSSTLQWTSLDRATAQDLCDVCSLSCSEGDLKPTVSSTDTNITLSHFSDDGRAPLAAQETVDELELQGGHVGQTNPVEEPCVGPSDHTVSCAVPASSVETPTSSSSFIQTSLDNPVTKSTQTQDSPVRSRRSRRDWEVGFRQVLLPFLQELESNQVLRGTWDWLMLRANSRGKPVQLHHLLVAWQRLYDNIPSESLLPLPPESAGINSSLFVDCHTVDSFLKRIKEAASTSCTSTVRHLILRHRDAHRHSRRHHHHHCHRHHTRTPSRYGPDPLLERPSECSTSATDDTNVSTTAAGEQERAHQCDIPDQNN